MADSKLIIKLTKLRKNPIKAPSDLTSYAHRHIHQSHPQFPPALEKGAKTMLKQRVTYMQQNNWGALYSNT